MLTKEQFDHLQSHTFITPPFQHNTKEIDNNKTKVAKISVKI